MTDAQPFTEGDLLDTEPAADAQRLRDFIAGVITGTLLQLGGPITVEALNDGGRFTHAVEVRAWATDVRLLVSVDIAP
jgi:hypothetical protein